MKPLKKDLEKLLTDLTVKHTSGVKYSMSRYRGQKGLFDITLEARTYGRQSLFEPDKKRRLFDLGIFKRTPVKVDSPEYKKLLSKHGSLRVDPNKVVSFPVLAKTFEKPEDALKILRELK